jgi:hypothetical protein
LNAIHASFPCFVNARGRLSITTIPAAKPVKRVGLTGMLPESPAFQGGVKGSDLKMGIFLTGEPA